MTGTILPGLYLFIYFSLASYSYCCFLSFRQTKRSMQLGNIDLPFWF